MRVLFEAGSDVPIVDGVPSAFGGFKDVVRSGMRSIEFDFAAHSGVIKWATVDDMEELDEPITQEVDVMNTGADGERVKVGTKTIITGSRRVRRPTGTRSTPADSKITYDEFYAVVSADLAAWNTFRAHVNQKLDERRHQAESEAAMEEAERENAAFEAAKRAEAGKPAPVESKPEPSADDTLKRIIEAHERQAIRNAERAKSPKEKGLG